jgi:hypothetical protein
VIRRSGLDGSRSILDSPGAVLGSPLSSVARYLLVDDRDGRVLAELASAHQAVRLLGLLECNPHADPPVSLVRLDHQQGGLIGVTSTVSMRPLPPPMARRGGLA